MKALFKRVGVLFFFPLFLTEASTFKLGNFTNDMGIYGKISEEVKADKKMLS